MELEITAGLTNVNVRREKAGEDSGPVAVDLAFCTLMSQDTLASIFSDGAAFKDAISGLWGKNGEPVSGIDYLKLSREMELLACRITCEQLTPKAVEMERVKASKFVVIPRSERMLDLKFRLQANPNKEQLSDLCSELEMDVHLELWSMNRDLLDDGDDEQQEAA